MNGVGKRSLLIISAILGSILLLVPMVSFARSESTARESFLSPLVGPTVTMTTPANPTTSSPVTLTATFSEPVIGFEIDDIVVNDGNATNLQPESTVTDTFTFEVELLSDWVTVTVPASVTVGSVTDQPNQEANIVIRYLQHGVHLPVINKQPFAILGGRIKLDTDADTRTRGVTTFDERATLDFSDLRFSYTPEEISASGESVTTSGPVTYAVTQTIAVTLDDPMIGGNQIDVQFTLEDENLVQAFTLFFIPNGDFEVDDITDIRADWDLSQTPTESRARALEEGTLRLGINPGRDNDCSGATVRTSVASLTMQQLPPDSGYHLHVEGTVFTQDQNPDNDDTYDAFEILINETVIERYSNQDPPIPCNPPILREVEIDANIPLREYSGETTLSLENHQRFDPYFHTYTKIDTVWIDY